MAVVPDPDRLAPIDVAVIGFTGDAFNGEIAPALLELVESGIVRIIDLVFVRKASDGSTTWVEVTEDEAPDPFGALTDEPLDMLSDEDLASIADDLVPGTAAMVVVWENRWLAHLAGAIFDSGGFLISQDRIPHDVVVRAVTALQEQ